MQERETAINPLDLSLTPETGLQSVCFPLCFPLLRCSRPSPTPPLLKTFSHSSVAQDLLPLLRFLWLRLKRLLIAWLIHSTCEGQSETPGRGGVPCENLWGSTAHRPPCLWLSCVWLYSAMWGTAHRPGHHNVCVCVCGQSNSTFQFSSKKTALLLY